MIAAVYCSILVIIIKMLSLKMVPNIQSLANRTALSEEEVRKRLLMGFAIITGTPVLVVFGIFHLIIGNYINGSIDFLFVIVLLLSLLILRFVDNGLLIFRLNTFFLFIMLLYLQYAVGVNGPFIPWLYVFPIVAHFLLGKTEGLIWCIVHFFCISVQFFFSSQQIIGNSYFQRINNKGIIVYIVIVALIHFYELVRQRLAVELEGKHQKLKQANMEMHKQMVEHSRARNTLRESEERLDLVLKGADLGMLDWNTKSDRSIINTKLAEILEFGQDELIHNSTVWKGIICPEDFPLYRGSMINHLKGTTPFYKCEFRVNTRSMSTKWLLASGKVVKRDSNGRALRMTGTILDITARKQVEANLIKSHNELERRVELRTKELEETNKDLLMEIEERKQIQEKLLSAKSMAEIANTAKSEFLANMSHELRTPMHGILSYSRFGIDKINRVSKEKHLHYFKQIHDSGERLLKLLNNLLDLSKLESGKMEYYMKEENIRQIIQAVILEFNPFTTEKRQHVNLLKSDLSTCIECDAFKIGQVVRNLLSNAIKFTPEGKTITIKFETASLPIGKRASDHKLVDGLTVKVFDQGVGIPENELEVVFNKFAQSSKTKTGAGGTGLGLAICSEIINAHKGKIWAENSSDGAVFNFSLPFKQIYFT